MDGIIGDIRAIASVFRGSVVSLFHPHGSGSAIYLDLHVGEGVASAVVMYAAENIFQTHSRNEGWY